MGSFTYFFFRLSHLFVPSYEVMRRAEEETRAAHKKENDTLALALTKKLSHGATHFLLRFLFLRGREITG